MNNFFSYFTPEEIYQIFKEENRFSAQIDFEVEDEISRDMTIHDWMCNNNSMPWRQIYTIMNCKFDINLSLKNWITAVEPLYCLSWKWTNPLKLLFFMYIFERDLL